MESVEKIKLLAKEKAFGIRRATRIGDSYGVLVPKFWLEMHSVLLDGDYYFQMQVEDGKLIISPLNLKDVENIAMEGEK